MSDDRGIVGTIGVRWCRLGYNGFLNFMPKVAGRSNLAKLYNRLLETMSAVDKMRGTIYPSRCCQTCRICRIPNCYYLGICFRLSLLPWPKKIVLNGRGCIPRRCYYNFYHLFRCILMGDDRRSMGRTGNTLPN